MSFANTDIKNNDKLDHKHTSQTPPIQKPKRYMFVTSKSMLALTCDENKKEEKDKKNTRPTRTLNQHNQFVSPKLVTIALTKGYNGVFFLLDGDINLKNMDKSH